jgi:hypothetical protein
MAWSNPRHGLQRYVENSYPLAAEWVNRRALASPGLDTLVPGWGGSPIPNPRSEFRRRFGVEGASVYART